MDEYLSEAVQTYTPESDVSIFVNCKYFALLFPNSVALFAGKLTPPSLVHCKTTVYKYCYMVIKYFRSVVYS